MNQSPRADHQADPLVYAHWLTERFDGRGLGWCFEPGRIFGELRSYLHGPHDLHYHPMLLLLNRAEQLDRAQLVAQWWPYLEGFELPTFYGCDEDDARRICDIVPPGVRVAVDPALWWGEWR